MRIAYLVNHYPAVSHSFIRREILALEKQGITVDRIALRGWDSPLVDPADGQERAQTRFVLNQGVMTLLAAVVGQVLKRPALAWAALRQATRMAKGSDKSLAYHWMYFVEACTVASWLRSGSIDHVHAHFGTNSAEVGQLASLLARATYSFTVHGPDEFDRPRAIGLAEKIRHAAFVVGISSFTRSQLFRWVERSHWAKIHVIHCGLDAGFYDSAVAEMAPSRVLVCVGRLGEQKGHLLLLEAMRLVVDRGHHFELVLAGDGEQRLAIEDRIVELGLASQVRITGWISSADVRRELLAARALVLPSFAEGLPVVIMEAMALRRPVITTFVAGIPELVRDGESGWLVPAGDAEALADAIVACLTAAAGNLVAMGDAGRRRVLARHDVDIEAAKLASLFRSLPTEIAHRAR